MEREKAIQILEMIESDMSNDAKNFDGQPFTGKTVATYNGHLGAAISGLANIIKLHLREEKEKESC